MTQSILRGVWQQPPSSAQTWAARGINTFVDLQHGASRKESLDACAAAGIKMLIAPDPVNPAADITHPGFLGWIQKPDEPENDEHIPTRDAAGRKDYAAQSQIWAARCANLKNIAPNVPIFGNFNGEVLTAARASIDTSKPPAQQNISLPEYAPFFSACDWASADWHVINSGRTADKILDIYTKMMTRLPSNKPTMAVVECAYEHRPENGPGPTAAEIRAQVWSALILGAKGIIYFPVRLPAGGYLPDGMSPEQLAAVVQCNDEIKRAERWLSVGKRVIVPIANAVAANWILDGTAVSASVRFNLTTLTVETTLTIPDEVAQLRDHINRIEQWLKAYPLA